MSVEQHDEQGRVGTSARPQRWRPTRNGLIAFALAASILGGTAACVLRPSAPPPVTPAQVVVQPGPSAAAAPQDALVSVAERVGPAVVSVRSEQGLGSGVIYDGGGLVLTNAHVVNGAREISVGLADGRRFSGRVLGADRGFDLAVVQIGGQGLPVAPLGDSASLRVGQFVAAIGNPYGFDHTVTTGVVSALNRPIAEGQESYAQPMIQTDAAINTGNSGGPIARPTRRGRGN